MPSNTSLLLNGAAILVVVASVGVVLRSTFVGEDMPSCKERFVSATRFALENNGEPLSAAELQGELANTDWGLTRGARVVKLKSGPAKHALELDLASAPSVSKDRAAERAGIGFQWAPQTFDKPKSACLTYSVFVPEGFTFGRGGRLPGLLGSSVLESEAAPSQFSTRYMWGTDGELDIAPQLAGMSEGRALGPKRASFKLTPGKWTELEQEVVLNTPGQADGALRVWQDGNLVFEKKNMQFRSKPSVNVSGVLAETAAGEVPAGTRRGPQKIWLTPFELRWK